MNNKIFQEEIKIIFNKLKNKDFFSFSKFADGEWLMMRNISINNNEFNYTNEDEFYKDKLIE
jgi:hypothetical protein